MCLRQNRQALQSQSRGKPQTNTFSFNPINFTRTLTEEMEAGNVPNHSSSRDALLERSANLPWELTSLIIGHVSHSRCKKTM